MDVSERSRNTTGWEKNSLIYCHWGKQCLYLGLLPNFPSEYYLRILLACSDICGYHMFHFHLSNYDIVTFISILPPVLTEYLLYLSIKIFIRLLLTVLLSAYISVVDNLYKLFHISLIWVFHCAPIFFRGVFLCWTTGQVTWGYLVLW